jgi:hypothetical protein
VLNIAYWLPVKVDARRIQGCVTEEAGHDGGDEFDERVDDLSLIEQAKKVVRSTRLGSQKRSLAPLS